MTVFDPENLLLQRSFEISAENHQAALAGTAAAHELGGLPQSFLDGRNAAAAPDLELDDRPLLRLWATLDDQQVDAVTAKGRVA